MSNASDICAARIIRTNSEGFESDVYDDANRKRIECIGEPTVGYGIRCRQWSPRFARGVLSLKLTEFEIELLGFPWYVGCSDTRRSALLEIAMNCGDEGLERKWPMLIAAVTASNWTRAKAECHTADPRLQTRYDRIGDILLTGVDQ